MEHSNTVLSLGTYLHLKQSLLYFDRVIPLGQFTEPAFTDYMWGSPNPSHVTRRSADRTVTYRGPPERCEPDFLELVAREAMPEGFDKNAFFQRTFEFSKALHTIYRKTRRDPVPWTPALVACFQQMLRDFGQNGKCFIDCPPPGTILASSSPVLGLEQLIRGVLWDQPREQVERTFQEVLREQGVPDIRGALRAREDTAATTRPDSSAEQVEVLLYSTSVKLIDVERCSWEHLREFRQDKDALEKMRRLRQFADANYSGKSKAFVEDDIAIRMEDCSRAVMKWGLETADGAVGLVWDGRAVISGAAGAMVELITGDPIAALGTIGMVEAIRVGLGALLFVKKRRMEREQVEADNPISYVAYAARLREERSASPRS
jgi:hypothetical protein